MKKAIQTIILALLTAVIISCGGSSDEITQGNEEYIPGTNTENTTVTYNELWNLQIEINKYQDFSYYPSNNKGKEYREKLRLAQSLTYYSEEYYAQEYNTMSESSKRLLKNNLQTRLRELEVAFTELPDYQKEEARPDIYTGSL